MYALLFKKWYLFGIVPMTENHTGSAIQPHDITRQSSRPARRSRQSAAVSGAAAGAAQGHRQPYSRSRRRAAARSAIWPRISRCRASRCAKPSTDWSPTACWCGARAREISFRRASTRISRCSRRSPRTCGHAARTPRSVWLKRAAGTVTPEEALALRLSPGTPVFPLQSHSLCRRCADGAGIRDHRRHRAALARGGRCLAV